MSNNLIDREITQGIIPIGTPKAYKYDAALVEAAKATVQQGMTGIAEKTEEEKSEVSTLGQSYVDSASQKVSEANTILSAIRNEYGYPFTAATAADMADTSKIYVYVGNETGYTNGNWYYHNGTAWTDGGVYNAVAFETDKTLTVTGAAADAKVTGDKISFYRSLPYVKPYISSNITPKKYLNSSGAEVTQNGWSLTDYIEVYNGIATYSGLTVISYNVFSAFYDSTKTLISDSLFNAQRNGEHILSVPTNAKYVRFSLSDADVNTFSIAFQNSPTMEEFEELKTNSAGVVSKLPYIYPYDMSDNTTGKYFDSTGALVSQVNWSITDYLPLGDFPQYSTPDKSNSVCFCYYNENKVFISAQKLGIIKDAFVDMLPPANAKYVRFSVVKENADKFSYRYQVCADANDVDPFANIIAIPNDLYLYAGIQTNIYRDSLFAMDGTPNDIKCQYGLNFADFWRYQPSASITADVSMTVQRYNTKYDKILAEKTTTLHFGTSSHNAGTVNCMFIGDSTTEQGRYLYPLLTNFSNDSTVVNSVGTRPTLNYPSIMCEGRSGWALTDYVTYDHLSTITNAFWNPNTEEFDFSYYMNTYQSGVSLDYVFILLGLNDVVGLSSTGDAGYHARKTEEVIASAQAFVSNLNTIAQSIKDYDNNITVVFGLITAPSKSQDAMRSSPSNGFHIREQYKRNIVIFNNEIIKGTDQTILKLLDTNLCIDAKNNMETATEQINSRNSNTIVRQNNLVHYPVEGGAQVADRIFAFLKCV